jgi:hypothetical protein
VGDPAEWEILLTAEVEAFQWTKWYRAAIPRAEQLYAEYLAERRKETTDE